MKVFISIPMRNKTEQQIEHDMIEAQYNIKNLISKKYPNEEIIFIDSFLAGAESLSPLFCLGYSLQSLSSLSFSFSTTSMWWFPAWLSCCSSWRRPARA